MEKYILLGPFRVPGCVLFGNRFQYPQILTSTGPAVMAIRNPKERFRSLRQCNNFAQVSWVWQWFCVSHPYHPSLRRFPIGLRIPHILLVHSSCTRTSNTNVFRPTLRRLAGSRPTCRLCGLQCAVVQPQPRRPRLPPLQPPRQRPPQHPRRVVEGHALRPGVPPLLIATPPPPLVMAETWPARTV